MAIEQFGRFDINTSPDGLKITNLNTTEEMANFLCKSLHFAKTSDRELCVYYDGVYHLAEDNVRACHKAICKQYTVSWRRERYAELEEHILIDAKSIQLKPDPNRINLLNGIYYVEEERFELHLDIDHSSYLTTIQLPILYDESATCSDVDKFMLELLPEGTPVGERGEPKEGHILYDVIGICMTSDMRQHKAVVLKGGGNNGKSVFLYGLRRMVGDENCASNTIHELSDSKNNLFIYSSLKGKLVNAGDDINGTPITVTDKLKTIISGNKLPIRIKYKSQEDLYPFCKLIFSTNHELIFPDTTDVGIIKRFMYIPLRVAFRNNPLKELELQRMFNVNSSGMFNRIRVRLKEILSKQLGFDMSSALSEIVDNYIVIPDLYKEWLVNNLVVAEGGKIPSRKLLLGMNFLLSDEAGYFSLTTPMLRQYIKHLFPTAKIDSNRRFDGVQTKCYTGLKLVSRGVAETLMSMGELTNNIDLEAIEWLDNVSIQ